MKKVVSAALIFILCCSLCCCSVAECTDVDLDQVNAMELTVEEWFSTEENRAKLTLLVFFELWQKDIVASLESYDPFESMVCKMPDGDSLAVFICGTNDTIVVFYTPIISYSQYAFMPKSSITRLQQQLGEGYGEMCPNTIEGITNAIQNM